MVLNPAAPFGILDWGNLRKFFFFFWLPHEACRILVPQAGIEPWSLAVKVQSLNHWTAKEFLRKFFMGKKKTNSLELSFSEELDLKTSELYRAEQVGQQKTLRNLGQKSPCWADLPEPRGAAGMPRPGAQAGLNR